jgi:hypothetical protein
MVVTAWDVVIDTVDIHIVEAGRSCAECVYVLICTYVDNRIKNKGEEKMPAGCTKAALKE